MIKKKLLIGALALLLGIILISCHANDNSVLEEQDTENDWQVSVWTTYWDIDRIRDEVRVLDEHIINLCYFAAYFDHNNQLFLPDATSETFTTIEEEFKDNEWFHYLTIVNDKINKDGSSSLKDTELLYTLFASEEKMNQHINDIIYLAEQKGYDGIEIDYEAIKQDMELWELYETFCELLYNKTLSEGLKLRIVLEPNAPVDMLNLPDGPEYIMMCYNLYGSSTGPGPKANEKFIQDLITKMSSLPGYKSFALATGGFDWSQDGNVVSVSEVQAQKLIKQYDAKPVRDIESQALKFRYKDMDQISHMVWYADAKTLHYWSDIVLESGEYGISIWRLGGNKWIDE